MTEAWDFESYQGYMNRVSAASGFDLVTSIEDAHAGWALRQLSRSDFERLQTCSKLDCDLGERWLNRLQLGYEREKSRIACEIETIFSEIPCGAQLHGRRQEDAA